MLTSYNALSPYFLGRTKIAAELRKPRKPYRPDDFPDAVSLRTAIDTLGLAYLTEEWLGDEWSTRMPCHLPECSDGQSDELAQFHSTLSMDEYHEAVAIERVIAPDRSPRPDNPSFVASPDNKLLDYFAAMPGWTIGEWRELRRYNQIFYECAEDRRRRWQRVATLVRDLSVEGRLTYWLRYKLGGAWIKDAITADHWNTELFLARLHFGEINPAKPFNFHPDDLDNLLIFVPRDALARAEAHVRGITSGNVALKAEADRDWMRLPGHLPELCEMAAELLPLDQSRPQKVQALADNILKHPRAPSGMTYNRALEWARVMNGGEQGGRRSKR